MVLDDSWREHTVKYGHAGVRPVHLVAFGLAIVNFLLNGLIWYAFHACSKIINKSHLYLFYAMAVTNCLTGFFSMPTFINLFAHDNINCPKWTIIVGSAFEMALDRMRAILALAIACERLFAIFRPRTFFLSDHKKNALKVCAFGAVWSIADALFMVFEDGLSQIRTHCVSTSSSGPLFHTYFLILSLIDGFGLFFVYVIFLVKFLSIRKSMPEVPSAAQVDAKQPLSVKRRGMKDLVAQANSLTITVIFCVLVFSVLPSMLYGYDMLMHRVVFMDLGPVITIGYHLHGITSSFCYNYKHREIRRALDKVYPIRKRVCLTSSSSTDKKSSDKNNFENNPRPSLTPLLRAVPEQRSSPPTAGTGIVTTIAPDIVVTDAHLGSGEDIML
ncbi:hypothetical protein PRIPAC_74511 [Pristionchus pacificus]|uniref:G protein-coupled receptor n=1 Tax=Pristionchus pacificus TaxID=54126 RepID=A0A2A6B4T9_PRIPA|nr:hypothetical protein PRIPAC_74511 [Pristionchus pacificus]|eukprot:PDM60884.1 G protein-coupled receptor [Pristionchus pacificus]